MNGFSLEAERSERLDVKKSSKRLQRSMFLLGNDTQPGKGRAILNWQDSIVSFFATKRNCVGTWICKYKFPCSTNEIYDECASIYVYAYNIHLYSFVYHVPTRMRSTTYQHLPFCTRNPLRNCVSKKHTQYVYIYIYTFEFNYSLFIYKHSPARTGLNHRVSTLLVSLFLLAELMPPSSSTVGIPIKAPSLRMAPQLPTGALSVSTMQDEGAADASSCGGKKTLLSGAFGCVF